MYSELRKDLVSGDWIVIAPGRANRPAEHYKNKEKRVASPIRQCPFEDPQRAGNAAAVLVYKTKKDWDIQVVPNKFPALSQEQAPLSFGRHGPYLTLPGVGFHDIVITRDHHKNFPRLSRGKAVQLLEAFRDRYRMFLNDRDISYVLIFHNWGPKAGASVYHPHYQIIALPIIPPDVSHSLRGSLEYFKKNKKCVHCVMIDYEKKSGSRVVFENNWGIAFAPFVSRMPFELRIFPKKHSPYFEESSRRDLEGVASVLERTLKILSVKLNDPDYNFFIHTSPLTDKKKYRHYHWHIEVLPKISVAAGFELGTGVDINIIDPDAAVKFLKSGEKIKARFHR